MMSATAIAVEFRPEAPCQTERFVWDNMTADEVVQRILRRFGVPPMMVAFRMHGPDLLMFGRDRVQKEKIVQLGTIFCGVEHKDIEAAKAALIASQWTPRAPSWDMTLPDGRDV